MITIQQIGMFVIYNMYVSRTIEPPLMVLVFLEHFSSCYSGATTPPFNPCVSWIINPFVLFFLCFLNNNPLCSYCISLVTNPFQVLLCLTFFFGTHDPSSIPLLYFHELTIWDCYRCATTCPCACIQILAHYLSCWWASVV